MARSVVLRHELSDGSWHYDWMIERADGRGLITFRTGVRPDGAAAFEAERLADHRVEYLEYEGEISGGRGRVSRVARGEVTIRSDSAREFACIGEIGGAAIAVRGVERGGRWEFVSGER